MSAITTGTTSIALSGALAQTQRLAASANNVANAGSIGAIPGADGAVATGQSPAYAPTSSSQASVAGANGQGQGTRAVFRPTTPAYLPEYQPDSAQANADGMVARPNVDLAAERVDQIGQLRAYQANLAVLRTEDEMQRSAINSLA